MSYKLRYLVNTRKERAFPKRPKMQTVGRMTE